MNTTPKNMNPAIFESGGWFELFVAIYIYHNRHWKTFCCLLTLLFFFLFSKKIIKEGFTKRYRRKKYAGYLNIHFCQYFIYIHHEQYEIIIIIGNKVFYRPFNFLCFFPLMLFFYRGQLLFITIVFALMFESAGRSSNKCYEFSKVLRISKTNI